METKLTTSLFILFSAALLHASVLLPSSDFSNVRESHGAKSNCVTDDTKALQRVINENAGRHRLLYFPHGTYLVSAVGSTLSRTDFLR